jgi:3D (Asp-Asp-Asp) domain-containing protein
MITILLGAFFILPQQGNAALGDRTLYKGMNNSDVKALQEYLLTKGVFPYHTTTGYYGPITEESVKTFQKKYGLKVDGIAGPKTNGKIKILRYGDIGKPVIELQRLLQAWGKYSGIVDGIFGQNTKNLVVSFQKSHGLTVDGIAGPETYKKLREKSASSSVKTLTVSSTAYTADCEGCSGITKMGINLKNYSDGKVIAVDPNVIPLGSKVEVEGYGMAIAADIGGSINGKSIDVFIPNYDDALQWGRKNVKVTVYEK